MAGRFWTDEEIGELRRLFGTMTAADIGKRINRSPSSIHYMAEKLGIATKKRNTRPQVEEAIRRRHPQGWSDQEIADELGFHRKWVQEIRCQMGLPANTFSEHRLKKIARKTREQVARAGFKSLAEVRAKAFRDYAKACGWPDDLRPRAVQILNALWEHGPMTRREITEAVGMPWKGSRKSLVSNDPGGSYLAYLQRRGLVVVLPRARQVLGQGKGRSQHIYMLSPTIQREAV